MKTKTKFDEFFDVNFTKMSGTPTTAKPFKDFKWMGFKSHMLATMAKWREIDYLTDTVFQCVRIF